MQRKRFKGRECSEINSKLWHSRDLQLLVWHDGALPRPVCHALRAENESYDDFLGESGAYRRSRDGLDAIFPSFNVNMRLLFEETVGSWVTKTTVTCCR